MYELYAKIMFLMGNNNSQTKAKGIISRGVGDKELEIRFSTTVFWAIYSNRHAILARNKLSLHRKTSSHLPCGVLRWSRITKLDRIELQNNRIEI